MIRYRRAMLSAVERLSGGRLDDLRRSLWRRRAYVYVTPGAVLAERAPVTLPPAIASSVTYRCADSRLIYVDYFTDDRAMVRVNGEGAPVILAGQGDRRSYSGSGYALDRQASDIRFTSPDIGTGLCKSGVPA